MSFRNCKSILIVVSTILEGLEYALSFDYKGLDSFLEKNPYLKG